MLSYLEKDSQAAADLVAEKAEFPFCLVWIQVKRSWLEPAHGMDLWQACYSDQQAD